MKSSAVYSRLLAAGLVAVFMIAASPAPAASPNENVDLEMMARIRQEGLRNSKVMETLSELTDRLGPRVTGSPNMKRANEWTKEQLEKYGLVNAHLESYAFGRGWSEDFAYIRMTSPDVAMLIATPEAWTPSTNGVVKGQPIKVNLETKEDLEKYKGKLAGKIVMLGEMREVLPHTEAEMQRYDEKRLEDIYNYQAVGRRGGPQYQMPNREEMMRRMAFRRELNKFLAEEKPAVLIKPSRGDGGTLFVQGGGSYNKEDTNTPSIPSFQMDIEHYGRIARLLDRNVPVELEVESRTKFYDDDNNAYNTIADIPGTDKKDEFVILGAHLDSWHGGTGATDNAAGVAVCMEAVRILKELGVKPRRTIRVGLWSGEEEGLLGSRAYVAQHLATRPEPPRGQDGGMPSFMRQPRGPLTVKPEWSKVSAYFNYDNGSGKIRGIYTQGNLAVAPIFAAWLQPFHDLGAETVTMRDTGGTDHQSFDGVGVPGFQFIQDPLEYGARTHHSNMDVYERAQRDDLMQSAVIMAAFVYNAAMRDDMMPRKYTAPDQIVQEKPAVETPAVAKKPVKAAKKEKAAKPEEKKQ
jgi:carboxypeptidase Q